MPTKILNRFFTLCFPAFLLFPAVSIAQSDINPVDMVNPYLGNISHLLVPTFPTIHLPNSMLRVYPERRDFTADLLNGLPLVVTSHRGSSAFNLSPYQGEVATAPSVVPLSYDNERITPYSYAVYLDEADIDVRYGLSHQSALYEIDFNLDQRPALIVNSRNGAMAWDGTAARGHQLIENKTKVYLYLRPENQPAAVSAMGEGTEKAGQEVSGKDAALVLHFPVGQKSVRLRYGISFISTDQAKRNLEREVAGKSLAAVHAAGRKRWNEALGKIAITGGTTDEQTVFYTSLYRTYERPISLSEDGQYYSAFDGEIHEDGGRPFHTDDWIWDSYRAHHPLRVLVDPEREQDIIHSFVTMAEQMDNLWMPTFPEVTGDSRRMNSNHGVASVIDAYRKGLRGFNLEQAYRASKNGIMEKTLAPWSGMPAGEMDRFYRENGYIPALPDGAEETIPEVHPFESRQPVAVTLGTAYDQWCLAQIAKELGNDEDYRRFMKAALNYQNLFNEETRFFHPKDKDGNFIEPFDYKFSGGMGARKFYGENNAWTYRWDVQHNVRDLIALMGGRDAFVRQLDATFREPLGRSKYAFYAQLPDHTGNVGQFSMANEPSLHIPYLYNYAGQPWKTQKRIRTLLRQWFRNDLMGVPGDEDGGGMTAFVVFSQLGFYPVTPGLPMYTIGSPVFETAEIQLANGKTFRVTASNYSPDHKYIQSARLNGKEWDRPWFSHDDLMRGGELELTMGGKPNKDWGSQPTASPPSFR